MYIDLNFRSRTMAVPKKFLRQNHIKQIHPQKQTIKIKRTTPLTHTKN